MILKSVKKESCDTSKNTEVVAGGKIEMPLAGAFWGSYFGMFVDKFGIRWMVNYEYKK